MTTFHVFEQEVQVILTFLADFFFLFFHFLFHFFLLYLFWFFFLIFIFVDILLLFFHFDELLGQRLSEADLFLQTFLLMCQILQNFLMFIFLTGEIVQKAIFALFLFLPDLNFLLDQFDKLLNISNIDVAFIPILPGKNILEVIKNGAIEFMNFSTIAVPLLYDVILLHLAK